MGLYLFSSKQWGIAHPSLQYYGQIFAFLSCTRCIHYAKVNQVGLWQAALFHNPGRLFDTPYTIHNAAPNMEEENTGWLREAFWFCWCSSGEA
jgi:hypothetical protein